MENNETPRLSPSTAKILLKRSALAAWTYHSQGGAEKSEDTDAKDRGKILDRLLFGVGPEIVVVREKDWRKTAAQEARDAAAEAGKLAVLVDRLAKYEKMVSAWKARMKDHGIALGGQCQVKLDWESDGVPCRGKVDHLVVAPDARSVVIDDLKTCEEASIEKVRRDITAMGYDIQGAAYVDGATANFPDASGRVVFRLLFAEITPPYDVLPVVFAGSMRELGERKWARAKRQWKECLASGKFPGLAPVTIEATAFQLADEMAGAEAAVQSDNDTVDF